MMRSIRSPLVVFVIAAICITSVSGSVYAARASQSSPCRYFIETRHYVCGEFLDYFESRGGFEIFGYPLTEVFEDPDRGLQVQYFQRARMEFHPYNRDPYKVLLGLLVDELGYNFPLANPDQIPGHSSSLHHYFSETGHVVSYAFLDFFRNNGGIDIFGYPRSEFMYEDGYIVQYFQRARMEWHPEDSAGPQMRLTNLAEIYVDRFNIPADSLVPQEPPSLVGSPDDAGTPTATPDVIRLTISASVRHVITGREGNQTVFVYVTDQWQQPIQGAEVNMNVRYQSGQEQSCDFDPTNASGFTNCSFEILSSPPGRKVVIDVTVAHKDLTGTTQTFFLPWW